MPFRLRLLRAPALAVLLALGLGSGIADAKPEPGAGGGKPAPPPRELAVPEGLPVQLDGSMTPAEWEGAAQAPLGVDGSVLKISQRRGTLQIGIVSKEAWRPGSRFWLMFVAA